MKQVLYFSNIVLMLGLSCLALGMYILINIPVWATDKILLLSIAIGMFLSMIGFLIQTYKERPIYIILQRKMLAKIRSLWYAIICLIAATLVLILLT